MNRHDPSVAEAASAGALVMDMTRRGVDHGVLIVGDRPPSPTEDAESAWATDEPVFLPDLLTERVGEAVEAIEATLRSFDRFRNGERLLDELDPRLAEQEHFEYQSSTVDLQDQREIEKVFVDARDPEHPQRRRIVRDLSAKLSWIADDDSDPSLRIRFSFGHESTRDWLQGGPGRMWSDRLCEAAFPERGVVTGHDELRALLDRLAERPVTPTETIVYNNAPGGGAVFHHDADPGQRGVIYAQMAGATVWLAIPKAELAALAGVEIEALDDPSEELFARVNHDPEFSAQVAATGRVFALGPGDALLLPSHDPEHCCWHSVFGSGEEPSLAFSFALFDAELDASESVD